MLRFDLPCRLDPLFTITDGATDTNVKNRFIIFEGLRIFSQIKVGYNDCVPLGQCVHDLVQ